MGVEWIHLLLKGDRCHSDINTRDEYLRKFSEKGLRAFTIPVLKFEYINIRELADLIQGVLEETNKEIGIIITSPRVAEALSRALELLEPSKRSSCLAKINQELTFVVGEKSGKDLELRLGIKHNLGSSQTGSGDALGKFIKEHCSSREGLAPVKLIYPKGSRSDENIEHALLKCRDIELCPVVVYNTYSIPNLTEIILQELKNLNLSGVSTSEIVINLIFFSPSGVLGFTQCDQHEFKTKLNSLAKDVIVTLRYCSIGRTTETALLEANFSVFCVAEKPNPTALVHAILHKSDQNILKS